jgi:hypothetical protein
MKTCRATLFRKRWFELHVDSSACPMPTKIEPMSLLTLSDCQADLRSGSLEQIPVEHCDCRLLALAFLGWLYHAIGASLAGAYHSLSG